MAVNLLISLTKKDDASTPIDVNTGDIISYVGSSSDADSIVKMIVKNQVKEILVDETPTAIALLSNDFIALTLLSDSSVTYYANAEKVRTTYVNGSGCNIYLDDNSSAGDVLKVTESQATVKAAVNAAV